MKLLLSFLLFCYTGNIIAQKYALLDKTLAQPVTYTSKVTSEDKFKDLFPVEKKSMNQFIKILQKIETMLLKKGSLGVAEKYAAGCLKFSGFVLNLAAGDRLDYVITSTCDNVKVSMHLCDARLTNDQNNYFIKTWIKYIRSYVK